MGRRALRKPDPNLDIAPKLLTREQMPDPWSTDALFGRDAPLEIEVGSGKGLFLERAATATPEHNFLGIEVSAKYARHCAARLARRSLDNGLVLSGDALSLFREALPDASLAAVHVYFPDPWWKKRHRKRRVLNSEFLTNATRTLLPGGWFHFWTDVREYYDATLELIDQTPLQSCGPVAPSDAAHDLDYHTHFERRTRLAGLPVYRSVFQKPTSG